MMISLTVSATELNPHFGQTIDLIKLLVDFRGFANWDTMDRFDSEFACDDKCYLIPLVLLTTSIDR